MNTNETGVEGHGAASMKTPSLADLSRRGVRSSSHPLHGVGRRKKPTVPPMRGDAGEDAD
jgi:hypothetical protein